MIATPEYDLATLLPHRNDALLLDGVTAVDDLHLQARLEVRAGTAFSDAQGSLPAWVGPEIMAQAIAAFSGHRSMRQRGRPAAIGLLLGIRSFACTVAGFRPGEALLVDVWQSSEDEDGRAVFDATITRDGATVASATLTVFQPPDDSFVHGELRRHG
jgi:predicted hotdog family 3-hydroxylacyl-ACP dehydratase